MISGQDRPGRARRSGTIVTRLPARPRAEPRRAAESPAVDSWYDAYLGVVVLVRHRRWRAQEGPAHRMIGIDASYEVDRQPACSRQAHRPVDGTRPREIGMLTASIKEVADTARRHHIHRRAQSGRRAAAGFRPAIPVVFSACFRSTPRSSRTCAAAMGKLRLNDAAFPTRWNFRRARFVSAAASSACCI